jgi:hypothetical protein
MLVGMRRTRPTARTPVVIGFVVGPAVAGALFGGVTIVNAPAGYVLGALYAYPLALLIGLPIFLWTSRFLPTLAATSLSGALAGGLPFVLLALAGLPSPFDSGGYTLAMWWRGVGVVPLLAAGCGLLGGLVLCISIAASRRGA